MHIDQRMLEKLLKLDDRQLENVIREVLSETGVSPTTLGFDASKLENVRSALRNATDSDLQLYQSLLDQYSDEKRNQQRRK